MTGQHCSIFPHVLFKSAALAGLPISCTAGEQKSHVMSEVQVQEDVQEVQEDVREKWGENDPFKSHSSCRIINYQKRFHFFLTLFSFVWKYVVAFSRFSLILSKVQRKP